MHILFVIGKSLCFFRNSLIPIQSVQVITTDQPKIMQHSVSKDLKNVQHPVFKDLKNVQHPVFKDL